MPGSKVATASNRSSTQMTCLVRAMMEGVAYAMYDSYRLIREAGIAIHAPMPMAAKASTTPAMSGAFDRGAASATGRSGP